MWPDDEVATEALQRMESENRDALDGEDDDELSELISIPPPPADEEDDDEESELEDDDDDISDLISIPPPVDDQSSEEATEGESESGAGALPDIQEEATAVDGAGSQDAETEDHEEEATAVEPSTSPDEETTESEEEDGELEGAIGPGVFDLNDVQPSAGGGSAEDSSEDILDDDIIASETVPANEKEVVGEESLSSLGLNLDDVDSLDEDEAPPDFEESADAEADLLQAPVDHDLLSTLGDGLLDEDSQEEESRAATQLAAEYEEDETVSGVLKAGPDPGDHLDVPEEDSFVQKGLPNLDDESARIADAFVDGEKEIDAEALIVEEEHIAEKSKLVLDDIEELDLDDIEEAPEDILDSLTEEDD